jgi:hypothetical protein
MMRPVVMAGGMVSSLACASGCGLFCYTNVCSRMLGHIAHGVSHQTRPAWASQHQWLRAALLCECLRVHASRMLGHIAHGVSHQTRPAWASQHQWLRAALLCKRLLAHARTYRTWLTSHETRPACTSQHHTGFQLSRSGYFCL